MSPERSLRVLIADDHVPTRFGIRLALEAAGIEVCGEAADAAGAVAEARRLRPDVALLDVRMPGDGIAAAHELSAGERVVAVVMLTMSMDEEDLLRSIRAGAAGYLLKDTNPERLPIALRAVLDGEAAIPRRLVPVLMRDVCQGGRSRGELAGVRLSPREDEVLEGLRQGASTADLAGSLGVSPVTVRRHVSALLRKLGVCDRRQAVALAERVRR